MPDDAKGVSSHGAQSRCCNVIRLRMHKQLIIADGGNFITNFMLVFFIIPVPCDRLFYWCLQRSDTGSF